MPTPSARNGDRTGVLAPVWWTRAHLRPGRLPTCAKAMPRASSQDYDPSRGAAVWHDNSDFARRAWRDHAELPDSVAELPFVGRGGLPARRFRRSRSGRGHTAGKQEPDNGSEHIETSCKKLHPDMPDRMSDALRARALLFSGLAIFGAPPASLPLASILAEALMLSQPFACAASANLWVCGQRKSVVHIPTGPTSNNQHQFDCFEMVGLRPSASYQPTVSPRSRDTPRISRRRFCADLGSHSHGMS